MSESARVGGTNMLTVDEVAKYLRVSYRTVLALVHKGELLAINVSAGKNPQYRIAREDLVDFTRTRTARKRDDQIRYCGLVRPGREMR